VIRLELNTLDDTKTLGLCLSEIVSPGDIILLSGDLGAGKTTLTRFLAQGLGIDEREVTSPTFNIIHEYLHGEIPLIHTDLYRLGEKADILDTGMEEYLDGDYLLVVEWADFLSEPLSDDYLEIHLTIEDSMRIAKMDFKGQSWIKRVKGMENCLEKTGRVIG